MSYSKQYILDQSMLCSLSAEAVAEANLKNSSVPKGDSLDKIISDLEGHIEDLPMFKDQKHVLFIGEPQEYKLLLPQSKLLSLLCGKPVRIVRNRHCPFVVDINAPILDGLFPLHLAILTDGLVLRLIYDCGAKTNVKCEDVNSPFYGMTPLEMALTIISQLIPWTPQLSLHHSLSMFLEEKPKILLKTISTLVYSSTGVRDLIFKCSLQGKVIELAALMLATCRTDSTFPTMYIPRTFLPPEHHLQVPVLLRVYVSSIISSLIRRGIQLSGQEGENCNKKMSEMKTIMKLLESGRRGDLARFRREQRLTIEDSCGIPKESQDGSWVNRYLNTSFLYIEPSLFQPRGIFNSLMPLGYDDSLHSYDVLDIRSDSDVIETILRELNGRKFEELCYQDAVLLRCHLGRLLRAKFEEENISTVIQNTSLPPIPKPEQKKCIEDWSSFTSVNLHPLRMIIEGDEFDKLKTILKSSQMKISEQDVLLNFGGCDISAYNILGKICHCCAIKCAVEFLSHVDSMLDLNVQNCFGSFPLHDAAITLSYSLVKLLVDNGAIRESLFRDPVTGGNISPLDYAVERLSCDKNLIKWSPKKSIFKLIITLCLPQMKEARDTITLLAGVETTSTIVHDAIFKAVKRGQVVPLAVLLLLARDRVLGDVSAFGNGGLSGPLIFTQSIMNELASLVNQEYALMGRKEHTEILQLCLEKKELMIYILQMLEIFDRVGSSLDFYLRKKSNAPKEQVSEDVAELLKKHFTLSPEDSDISDVTSSPEPEPVQLSANLEQEDTEDAPKGIWFKPCRQQLCQCGLKLKHSACTTSYVFHRIAGTSFSYSQYRDFSSHAGPLLHQPSRKEPICFLPSSLELSRKVERQEMIRTAEKTGTWLQLRMSNIVVRSGSIFLAAVKRRLRGV